MSTTFLPATADLTNGPVPVLVSFSDQPDFATCVYGWGTNFVTVDDFPERDERCPMLVPWSDVVSIEVAR